MEVTLTARGAELLRQVMDRKPGQAPEDIIEDALAHEVTPALQNPLRERLKSIPGIKLPLHSPPCFKRIEPLKTEGEFASERLIRERR